MNRRFAFKTFAFKFSLFRYSEEDPAFFAPLYRALDTSNAAILGFSAGGALGVYAAEESQRVWPGRVRAVVALAPTTVGRAVYSRLNSIN
jgi:pimeloyl-ACP methyl ester carboxylesterase